MNLDRLKVRRMDPVAEAEALAAEKLEGVQIYESDCEGSEYLDHLTVYVAESTRMVTMVADYSPFVDTRKVRGVPTGRRCMRGKRKGKHEDLVAVLESLGLVIVDGEG